jgi:TPR repeat protein
MCDEESKANSRWGRIGNRIKAALAAFVLSLSLAAPIAAGPLEDGIKAANRKDYGTAVRLLRPLAEQGNSQAQGLLAFMYEFGKGVPQDYTEAAKWYRKGAEQGDRQAQFNLATMYANGRGVPHDEAESDRWYRKAAEQGDALAQSLVGSAYLFGRGAPKDFVQAYMWLNLAAHGGAHGAAQTRDGLEPFMTAEEIAEAQRLTREWKPK